MIINGSEAEISICLFPTPLVVVLDLLAYRLGYGLVDRLTMCRY